MQTGPLVKSNFTGNNSNMNTPPDVRFHPEFRLLTWHPRGVLDSDTISKLTAFIEDEEQGPEDPFNRFIDLSGLSAVDLEFEYVVHVSMHRRRAFKDHDPVKSAFFVTTPEIAHLARVHATLNEFTPLHVGVFFERSEAAKWLEVPEEILRG